MKILKNFNIAKQKVLVRCDFNVPFDEKGKILDDFKIRQSLPTIKYLIKNRAKIILMSHLGRPKKNQRYSLKVIALRLTRLLKQKVMFLDECLGPKVKKETEKIMPEEIILLENLRLYKQEEENDDRFAKELAGLADIYINDAFGACHRVHASVVGVPNYLPAVAGLLLEKEIKILTVLMKNPKKPLITIIGGKKVETKVKVIEKISIISDFVLIGDLLKREIIEKRISFQNNQKIIFSQNNTNKENDISLETIKLFRKKIMLAKTVFWNGPLGMTEREEFSKGTRAIIQAIIESRAFSVIGGGETIEFINRIGLIEKFNHVSTGGGAMLEFLSGAKLPGLEPLK